MSVSLVIVGVVCLVGAWFIYRLADRMLDEARETLVEAQRHAIETLERVRAIEARVHAIVPERRFETSGYAAIASSGAVVVGDNSACIASRFGGPEAT